jgi:hypothetical protein
MSVDYFSSFFLFFLVRSFQIKNSHTCSSLRIFYFKEKMHSRVVLVLCTIAVVLYMVSSTVDAGEEHFYPRSRKLSNVAWLAAPHFQALPKRDRFVFRDAPNGHFHDSSNIDMEDVAVHPDKRNWRL